jgi:fucose permease
LKDVIPDVYKTLEDEDYQVLMWTSVADAPGILLAVVLVGVPCLARKLVMVSEFGLLAMCTGLLLICVDRIYLTFVLFVCRAVIACAFQTVFLYTSEVYSQPSRSVGLALCVTVGHLGGIVAPYVAQTLLAGSDFGGILVFIFFASFAGIFAGIIPTETRNNDFKIVKCTS